MSFWAGEEPRKATRSLDRRPAGFHAADPDAPPSGAESSGPDGEGGGRCGRFLARKCDGVWTGLPTPPRSHAPLPGSHVGLESPPERRHVRRGPESCATTWGGGGGPALLPGAGVPGPGSAWEAHKLLSHFPRPTPPPLCRSHSSGEGLALIYPCVLPRESPILSPHRSPIFPPISLTHIPPRRARIRRRTHTHLGVSDPMGCSFTTAGTQAVLCASPGLFPVSTKRTEAGQGSCAGTTGIAERRPSGVVTDPLTMPGAASVGNSE